MTMQDRILKIAVSIAAVVALSLSEVLLDTERRNRNEQANLLFAALLYTAAGMAFLSVNAGWGQKICDLAYFLQYGEAVVLNILLMLPFLLLKWVFRRIVSSRAHRKEQEEERQEQLKWRIEQSVTGFTSAFYQYDAKYDAWLLKKKWVGFLGVCRALRLCGIFVTAGMLAATWIAGPEIRAGIGTQLIWFPCGALILANEICGFLGGLQEEEVMHEISGDEADSRKMGNLSKIREVYEELFGDLVLAAHTGCEFSARTGAAKLLEDLGRSEEPVERAAAYFFQSFPDKKLLDVDGIQVALKALQGKSILFFNPFYRDLEVYLALPLLETLMKGRKCLLIAGRSSIAADAVPWLSGLLERCSPVPSLWTVKELGPSQPECEIGILRFQRIYDVELLVANRGFFREVGFVLFLEPSLLLDTGQVGISMIAGELCGGGNVPVYCICDRYADGLLDTMSHLLRTEIAEAASVSLPRRTYTGMAWDVDGDFLRRELFDRQTRFLGSGVELAAVAIRNQAPGVAWHGEKKAPLKDIKWIAGQSFPAICRYMNLPAQQESLYDKIRFVPGLWSDGGGKESFVIVEDEFCNMFSMMRTFLSRGEGQIFVNVLSENYLLRDYMRCNQQIFLSNPAAIPSFMPDYAKTERNTILKLIIMMAIGPVSEDEAVKELRLAGCGTDDTFDAICDLLQKYTQADSSILDIRSVTQPVGPASLRKVMYYSIAKGKFDKYFASTLRTACYIVEEERDGDEFLDAKMYGHVAQTILPGQYVTYNGKYYEARTVSPEEGVILRRASSLYLDRRYYRQIRTYHFEKEGREDIVSLWKVMDVEVAVLRRSLTVFTHGYLDMGSNQDLRLARVVNFEGDPAAKNYTRRYRNKNILRLRFPETDEKIRFTLCLLISEIFRSVFPDSWQYLAVLARRPEDIDGVLNYALYTFSGDLEDDFVYIVEDSDMDLGLSEAVVRNLRRILEITADFLDWHFMKMREPEREDPSAPSAIRMPQEAKKRSMFLKMAERIRQLFGGREEVVQIETPEEVECRVDREQQEEREGQRQDTGTKAPEQQEECLSEFSGVGDAALLHVDGTDIFEEDSVPEDNEWKEWIEESLIAAGIVPVRKTRYQEKCYLKFGFDEIDARLRIEDVRDYLHLRGYCNNALAEARSRKAVFEKKPDLAATNCCDFCRRPLSGASFERLSDGRVRCNDCSATAVTTLEECGEIFHRLLEMMEILYGITFTVPIRVTMTDARTIAKGYGCIFKPSTDYSARVLGYARKQGEDYSIVMENGSPRLEMMDTIVHELTHVWQYLNWDAREIGKLYRMGQSACDGRACDAIYEGMATWTSIQYMYQIGETYHAQLEEERIREDTGVYGIGFSLYQERYPLVKDLSLMKYTPFRYFPPLDPQEVRGRIKAGCGEKTCTCHGGSMEHAARQSPHD